MFSSHLFPFCQLDIYDIEALGNEGSGHGMRGGEGFSYLNDQVEGSHLQTQTPFMWTCEQEINLYRVRPLHFWVYLSWQFGLHWIIQTKYSKYEPMEWRDREDLPQICVYIFCHTIFMTSLGNWLSKEVQIIFYWAWDGHPFWIGNSFTWFNKQNVMKRYVVLTLTPAPSTYFLCLP